MKKLIGVFYNITNGKLNTYAVYDIDWSRFEVMKLETMFSHYSNKESFPLKYFSTPDLAWEDYVKRLQRMKRKLEAEIEGKRNTLHGIKLQLEKLVVTEDDVLSHFFEE